MISHCIKNICLISFALFAPVYLPAGGIQRNLNNLYCFNKSKEIVLDSNRAIFSMPDFYSKKLRYLRTGSTLLILRHWQAANNDRWLRVQLSSNIFENNSNKPIKGWIQI